MTSEGSDFNGSTQEPLLGRQAHGALSSAWKSTWFATKGPGVQIPQRPPFTTSMNQYQLVFSLIQYYLLKSRLGYDI